MEERDREQCTPTPVTFFNKLLRTAGQNKVGSTPAASPLPLLLHPSSSTPHPPPPPKSNNNSPTLRSNRFLTPIGIYSHELCEQTDPSRSQAPDTERPYVFVAIAAIWGTLATSIIAEKQWAKTKVSVRMLRVCVSAQTQQNQDRQACSTCRCVHVCTHTHRHAVIGTGGLSAETGSMLHLLPIIGC